MAQKNATAASTVAPSTAPSTPGAAPAQPQQMGCLAAIVRLTWLAIGSIALISMALLLLKSPGFSGKDVAFWVVPVATIGVRWLDIACFKGMTTEGKPATMGTLGRYAIKLLVASGVLWGIAHAVARAIA